MPLPAGLPAAVVLRPEAAPPSGRPCDVPFIRRGPTATINLQVLRSEPVLGYACMAANDVMLHVCGCIRDGNEKESSVDLIGTQPVLY
jgi:hypothetical protein